MVRNLQIQGRCLPGVTIASDDKELSAIVRTELGVVHWLDALNPVFKEDEVYASKWLRVFTLRGDQVQQYLAKVNSLGQELFAADLLTLAQLTDEEAAGILNQEPDSFDKPKS